MHPAPMFQPGHAKRKRSDDCQSDADVLERVHPSKQARGCPPSDCKLSEQNLRFFNGEEMDDVSDDSRRRSSKRSSAASDMTQETVRTQRSSGSIASYRFGHLTNAQVYLYTDPPHDIQKAIDTIVKAETSQERRTQLNAISHALHNDCTKTARAAVGEDDFVRLFHTALTAMATETLCLREKADWQEELKPQVQRSRISLTFLADFDFTVGRQQQKVDDAAAPPPKRQQQSTGQGYMSPQTSTTDAFNPAPTDRPQKSGTMFPPPPSGPKKGEHHSPIKTPRPDISIGIAITALTSSLSSYNLNSADAQLFLRQLQETTVRREPKGPQEPILIPVPASRASDLTFPFAVVEGKAYSTGRQVFEAENQAAVTGACGLKIQICLDELVERVAPAPSQGQPPTRSDLQPAPAKDQAAEDQFLQDQSLQNQSAEDQAAEGQAAEDQAAEDQAAEDQPATDQPALFFSICTEGPIHELWVHWTNVEHGRREFHMKLLKICHGALLESVEDFIVGVDNVLRWGTGPFLASVAERLGKVTRNLGA